MKRPGIIVFNLLIMLGYSMLFMALGPVLGDSDILVHWSVLGIHILALFVIGLANLGSAETSKKGRQFLLASLLVALIGHGLCVFNGLMQMSGH